jgi:transcriptional regulator with XRE-family HTH domain
MKSSTAQQTTANAVRVQLARKNRSQRWLADELGMTTHALSRRMTGKTRFTTDDIDRIAEVFGMDFITFITSDVLAAAA